MLKNKIKKIILLTAIVLLNISCKDNPIKPENHDPVITSLAVFPDIIGMQDSAVVICNAYDPDGDTLVYDWITDGRLIIKGAPYFEQHILYNTYENSRIFYPNQTTHPYDSAWVQCFARDRKGGGDAMLIVFAIKQNSGGD